MQAKHLMELLVRIQQLQFFDGEDPATHPELKNLRAEVPPQVLGHADRLIARGKKAVAVIEHNVCTGCRMGLPVGTVLAVRHGVDFHLCGNCGRYLHLPAEPDAPAPEARPKRKRAARKSQAEAA